jgi:excisionase family DNA binding protein
VPDEVLPRLVRTLGEGASQSHGYHVPETKPRAKARVVSVGEAAAILGLRPSTIRAWIGARKIASVHLGRRVIIPAEAIDDLLSTRLTPAQKTFS